MSPIGATVSLNIAAKLPFLQGTPTEHRRHAKEVGRQFDAPRPVGPQATDEGLNKLQLKTT